ncbi:MAG: metallophosphoesterase [Candidatus Bipolaricaulota bacterium]|nr:metallophosphoesterase [Candidatus Bipolaricaulota bacterium]
MAGKYVGVLFAALLSFGACAWGAEGWVFMDANRNGAFDAGEVGVADAAVSDGVTVVRTDAGGRFDLAIDAAARFVFLSTPNGTHATRRWYVPVAASAAYAFPLESVAQSGPLVFVQLSDLHYAPDAASFEAAFADRRMAYEPAPILDQIVAEANALAPDFVILTGDIVANAKGPELPDVEAWMKFGAQSFAARFTSSFYAAVGNHDVVRDPAINETLYERYFGPTYYSFNVKGTHCVVLNTHQLAADGKQTYSVSAAQLEWLRQDFAFVDPDAEMLVFCHEPSPDWTPTAESKALYTLLAKERITALLDGHWHTNFVLQEEPFFELTSGAVCGAWWEGPGADGTKFGYRVVEVRRGQLDSIWRNVGENAVFFRRPTEAALAWTDRLTAQVWGAASSATYRWDNSAEVEAFVTSNGLWSMATANLNVTPLAAGYHTLTVTFALTGGVTARGERAFLVLAPGVSLADLLAHPQVFQGRIVGISKLEVRAAMGADVSATEGGKTIIVSKFPFAVAKGDFISLVGLFSSTSVSPIKTYDGIFCVKLGATPQ